MRIARAALALTLIAAAVPAQQREARPLDRAEERLRAIYERGEFDEHDRIQTALALRAYGYGLICYAAIKIVQPAFYAIDRRWVPMMESSE